MIAISARSKNNVIGRNGKLPWQPSKEDFAFFREITLGKTLLMGKKTWDNLPKLKNREILVIDRYCASPYLIYSSEADNSKAFGVPANIIVPEAIVCGGAKTYEKFLPYCECLYMTEFDFEVEGDTYFPEFQHMFPSKNIVKKISNGIIYKYSK